MSHVYVELGEWLGSPGAIAAIVALATTLVVEWLRAKYAIAAHRNQALVERQGTVIAELYRLLVEAEVRCTNALSAQMFIRDGLIPASMDDPKPATRAIRDMVSYYARHRIYFTRPVMLTIEGMQTHFSKAWSFAAFGPRAEADELIADKFPSSRTMLSERVDDEQQAWMIITRAVPAARQQLEKQFRQLLGVK